MALTGFQSGILRSLAANRRATAGSYVAGGLALNYRLGEPRQSRDIDIFNDSAEVLLESWKNDRATLEGLGYIVTPRREMNTFIEAYVSKDGEQTEIQWAIDSAYRFFPLQRDPVVGFTLHPLDLAANKLAALVGRTEPRDWIDVITAIKELQPFACLLSAACGKDPGFSPTSMLEYVARRHYNQVEIDEKIIPRGVYDAGELCRFWHEEVSRTRLVLEHFPRSEVGKAVMAKDGSLFKGDAAALEVALAAGELEFHEGTIGGAWPRIIG